MKVGSADIVCTSLLNRANFPLPDNSTIRLLLLRNWRKTKRPKIFWCLLRAWHEKTRAFFLDPQTLLLYTGKHEDLILFPDYYETYTQSLFFHFYFWQL